MTNTPGERQQPQDPYNQPSQPQPGYPPQAPMQYAPDHPQATTALVLGIVGTCILAISVLFFVGVLVLLVLGTLTTTTTY